MKHTFGIGVIGMGWMGQVHSRSYRQIPDRFREAGIQPRLVICSDNVDHRATDSQDRFGFEQSTTNWHEVIEHPDVDVVNIAAPNGLHLEMVRAAAAAGKHIFCEKPRGQRPRRNRPVRTSRTGGGRADVCGLQLPLGTAGSIHQTTHREW